MEKIVGESSTAAKGVPSSPIAGSRAPRRCSSSNSSSASASLHRFASDSCVHRSVLNRAVCSASACNSRVSPRIPAASRHDVGRRAPVFFSSTGGGEMKKKEKRSSVSPPLLSPPHLLLCRCVASRRPKRRAKTYVCPLGSTTTIARQLCAGTEIVDCASASSRPLAEDYATYYITMSCVFSTCILLLYVIYALDLSPASTPPQGRARLCDRPECVPSLFEQRRVGGGRRCAHRA